MSILNARLLGPDGVGVLALLHLLRELSIRLTNFGFGKALRYYSANGEIAYPVLKRVIIQLGVFVGFLVIVVSFILKFLPINIWDDIDINVYLLFLPTSFFFVLISYMKHLLHGQLLINVVNLSNVLQKVLYILFFILSVWYLELGLIGVSISFSVSAFLLFVFLFFSAIKHEKALNQETITYKRKGIIKKLWRYGKWVYYSQFIQYIVMQFPLIFLKSFVGEFSQVGYFQKAQGLSNYPKKPSVQLSGLLFSFNAGSNYGKANNRTEIICRFSFFAVTIFFIILGLFIKPIISLLYGNEFLPAANVFYFLYPSIAFYIQANFLSTALAAKGFSKDNFNIRLRSLPIILIINIALISYLDIIGAALALSITQLLLWYQYARKYFAVFDSSFKHILILKKQDVEVLKIAFKKIIIRIKK